MRVLIVLPARQTTTGGNWTYANRLQRGLRPRGIFIDIINLENVSRNTFLPYDGVHAFNVFRTGIPLLPLLEERRIPLVATCTGTDINHDFENPFNRPGMFQVVARSCRTTFLTENARQRFLAEAPRELHDKTQTIPLGIDLPETSVPLHDRDALRRAYHLPEDAFVFLLPAGIRPVKDPLCPLPGFDVLAQRHPHILFVLAGPPTDPDLVDAVLQSAASRPWMRYLGPVPHDDIPALLQAADVVLNTSRAEGFSHAAMEAMLMGKPILATRVPGNAELVDDPVTGFLFAGMEEFVEKAEKMVTDRPLLHAQGQAARAKILREFPAQKELDAFEQMYRAVFAKKVCPS
jgi:glycosyltransferase involved in cell wall biosynthesis